MDRNKHKKISYAITSSPDDITCNRGKYVIVHMER